MYTSFEYTCTVKVYTKPVTKEVTDKPVHCTSVHKTSYYGSYRDGTLLRNVQGQNITKVYKLVQ